MKRLVQKTEGKRKIERKNAEGKAEGGKEFEREKIKL